MFKSKSKDKAEKENASPSPVPVVNGSGREKTPEHDSMRPMTPTKLTRLEEKNTLIGLNNRLANILDKNRQLELENSKLNGQLQSAEQTLTVTTNKLKQTYEKESVDLRKRLENVEKDKTKFDLNCNNLQKDLADLSGKLQIKDKDLNAATAKIRDLEKTITNLNLELKKIADERDKLAKEKDQYEKDSAGHKKALDDLRKKLEQESVIRIELENALRNKGEELELKKQVHEQEVQVMMTKKNNELENIGSKLEKDYEIKLERTIKQLRDDCNRQIADNKLDQDNIFNKKEDSLKKTMEKTRLELLEKSQELSSTLKKLNDMEKKILTLDGEKYNLIQNLKDVEKKWKEDVDKIGNERNKLDNELRGVLNDKAKLLDEYGDLMEVKIGLDNELAVYRGLLEREEDRLKISFKKDLQKAQKDLEKQIII